MNVISKSRKTAYEELKREMMSSDHDGYSSYAPDNDTMSTGAHSAFTRNPGHNMRDNNTFAMPNDPPINPMQLSMRADGNEALISTATSSMQRARGLSNSGNQRPFQLISTSYNDANALSNVS